MVYFPTTEKEPPCLALEKKKKSGNHNCEGVIKQLSLDFHQKCYLCEDTPQSIETEHFKSKANHPELVFRMGKFILCL